MNLRLTVIIQTLVITVLISIFFTMLTMLLSSRANKALLAAKDSLEERVKQRTLELENSEHLLQLVIDNVPGPVFYKDAEGRHKLVNKVYEEIVGVSREFVMGKTDEHIFPADIAKSIMDYIFRWLELKFIKNGTPKLYSSIRWEIEETSDSNGHNTPDLSQQSGTTINMQSDSPACSECGAIMVRSGSCYGCLNCGATSGCS